VISRGTNCSSAIIGGIVVCEVNQGSLVVDCLIEVQLLLLSIVSCYYFSVESNIYEAFA
jgi:hypothetical protein